MSAKPFVNLKDLWRSDASRYTGSINSKNLTKLYFLSAGFKYSFWLRISSHYLSNRILYPFLRIILQHYSVKFGIEISPRTKIGKGLSIAHFGGIVIHNDAEIGENLDIRQGVTIGNNDDGVPTLGNNVFIGAGAKIIGNINIGNGVKIGANAVVLQDVPDNCTAVGIPARIIS